MNLPFIFAVREVNKLKMESLETILQNNGASDFEPSQHSKTLIMRAKKKDDNGLFSWDNSFFQSNMFWFSTILILEFVGLFIIGFTSIESDIFFLAVKLIAILLLAYVDYLIAREVRIEDNVLNLHKTKKDYYESYFEIYDKSPQTQVEAKENYEFSVKEINRINKKTKRWLYLLITIGLFKCAIFYLEYFINGTQNIIMMDFYWLFYFYCFIYLTIPFLHWNYYSFLYWIKMAHESVVEELKEHSVLKDRAIANRDIRINIPNCKVKRPISFDIIELRPSYAICNTVFINYIRNPITYPGLLSDGEGQNLITTQKVNAAAGNPSLNQNIFGSYLKVQFLNFKIHIAEKSLDSVVFNYDHNIRGVRSFSDNLSI